MKTLIISDIHLTNKFHQRTFDFLKELFDSVDQVIINGDFWDGYITNFDKFVNSAWQNLFPILEKKETHYNFGNHDKAAWHDNRVNYFSKTQGEVFKLNLGDKELIIKHGNDIDPSIDEKYPFLDKKLLTDISYKYTAFHVYNILNKLFSGNFYQIHPAAKKSFDAMRNWARENMQDHQALVCSHSHIGIIDWLNKFLSTGFLQGGWAEYLMIENGQVKLLKHRY